MMSDSRIRAVLSHSITSLHSLLLVFAESIDTRGLKPDPIVYRSNYGELNLVIAKYNDSNNFFVTVNDNCDHIVLVCTKSNPTLFPRPSSLYEFLNSIEDDYSRNLGIVVRDSINFMIENIDRLESA